MLRNYYFNKYTMKKHEFLATMQNLQSELNAVNQEIANFKVEETKEEVVE